MKSPFFKNEINVSGGRMKSIIDSIQLSRLALEDTEMVVNGKKVPTKQELQRRLQLINVDLFFR